MYAVWCLHKWRIGERGGDGLDIVIRKLKLKYMWIRDSTLHTNLLLLTFALLLKCDVEKEGWGEVKTALPNITGPGTPIFPTYPPFPPFAPRFPFAYEIQPYLGQLPLPVEYHHTIPVPIFVPNEEPNLQLPPILYIQYAQA